MATSQGTPDDHQHEAGFLHFLTTVNEALPPAGFVDASEFILPSTTVTLPTTSTLTITTPGISKPLLTTRMTSTTTSTLTASASPRNPAPGNATWLGPYTVTIHEVSISNASMPIITLTIIPNNTISGSSDVTTTLGYTETSVIVTFGGPATSANGAIAALLPNVYCLAGVLLGLWTWGI
ncbi:hypothetical protein LTR05_001288 [Lithohypha guttulata]|uniref:Uncharacterized protein n=1 Tax=Lithohypha guttulata TaxID=1690604 RepID=A0AAN7T669_9EURO|nr:hypothetical protein LTR05_001288 [Lithohypha guttulata]